MLRDMNIVHAACRNRFHDAMRWREVMGPL
jgi:hypothetical protein